MDAFTIIEGARAVPVQARVAGGHVLLDPASLRAALGWDIHDGLLCSDAMCVRIQDEAALVRDGAVDLQAFARVLDRPLAVDVEERVACLGASARERAATLASQIAPDFQLPDLAGRLHALSEHRDRKILLVTWASW
jgi:hypothetical protein